MDTTSLVFAADRANTYFPVTNLTPGEQSKPFNAYFMMDKFWNTETECVDLVEVGHGIVAKIREGNQGFEEAKAVAVAETFTKDGPFLQVQALDKRDENENFDSYIFSVC